MNPNSNIETEFGFDEYIMPSNATSTFTTMSKVESFDAQLYPSGTPKFSYHGEYRVLIWLIF